MAAALTGSHPVKRVRTGFGNHLTNQTSCLLGRSVERVHLKFGVRWTARKRPFQELLRNRISEAKYGAPEKAAL